MVVSIDLDVMPPVGLIITSLEGFALDIRSYREPLKRAVQKVIAPSFQENFDMGGRPTWAPLAEITKEIKTRLGYELSPLIRTRLLRTAAGQLNLWEIDTESASITLDVAQKGKAGYGGFHQEGTRWMPARPWAIIQDDDQEKIEQIFWAWIAERMWAKGWTPGVEGVLQESLSE